jgi:hypothetical protein
VRTAQTDLCFTEFNLVEWNQEERGDIRGRRTFRSRGPEQKGKVKTRDKG